MASAFGHGFDTRHLHHETHEIHKIGFCGLFFIFAVICYIINNIIIIEYSGGQ